MSVYLVEYCLSRGNYESFDDYVMFEGSSLDYVKTNAKKFLADAYSTSEDNITLYGIFEKIGDFDVADN